MRTHLLCLTTALLGAGFGAGFARSLPPSSVVPDARGILESYVEDFRTDPAASEPRLFGIRITGDQGGAWNVQVEGEQDAAGRWRVELHDGDPERPAFIYTTDLTTLAAIDAGSLNALTAQGKAFPGDPTPLSIEAHLGWEKQDVNAFSFHFWTRGFPEIVPLAAELGRVVHGVSCVPIYYQPGFRSIWATIAKGERVNNGPGQPMLIPFPAVFVSLRGTAVGDVGGQLVELPAGEAMFVPPMTPYEFWNEAEEPAEALLMFFGEGA